MEAPKVNVSGLEFGWDVEKGQFLFEGEDAVLFWISSAMKTFFDTIEEVSGEEATSVVLETTGYRQGTVVGDYFERLHVSEKEFAETLTRTYASAGWGKAVIDLFDTDQKKVIIRLRDDWEYKINIAQGKSKAGSFLPAHYAGIFTGLFGTNIWYRILQSQVEGKEETVVEYFPSEITVTENIHKLIRSREQQEIMQLEAMVEDKTQELKALIRTLSSPMIPVMDGVVVVPLLGMYDKERTDELIEKTLHNLPKHKATFLILDFTGLDSDIASVSADLIEKLVSATSLIGAKTILVGIKAELSLAITKEDIDLSNYDCFQTLEHGIYYALAEKGRKIISI
ncbi:anti-sigma-factor antagonist [Alkalihalophilus pseudofirmus OF4]|uniref:Anti-sigma-factor antagonist n=1 Tax=Alkalihalophilus pseudofirmus (strain ATCC BAA-2126 / JCM 17055 / OF4) TaxID=398511 RepID=D3FXC7_ALKPO|nr:MULTISPECIES: STAS domain-containing protein [Alkalihalophilus]ADC50638.1 anti-sigma-factor antagonist [Alkalihalophilus pseudofirmus OF4]MED1602663.1 STAS domain-containing protein [Alkalihalophilus marmarensis]